ncbi:hypothetical protein BST27_24640 [Mycobacterium intermedium]|uniref:Cation-transporting P-type ATPase C-terminal domain-containing protein n=1 Tax=Mycobacterium intermedium TaxID=28445 RepID=A0A1E3S7X9_MYCIE|nr:hypothetical protein BHQ20_25700 [Mycobacterium intermedium]OPE47882.1 hypothetical protein BV508_20300 [Mycobacterium intermedium]ORA96672.1 hypothetical protein BST27_24640 [Mycobacterium intermedium]
MQVTTAALGKSAGGVVKSVARDLSRDLSRETMTRRCTRNGGRAWIEVRGLESHEDLGRVVLDAMRAHRDVQSARLNYPLSRVVVDFDDSDTSLRALCRVVEEAEKRCESPQQRANVLPADGTVPVTRAVTVAATAAGLGVAQRRLSEQQARSVSDDPDDVADFCGDGLTLVGFLGLSDTPRPQAAALLADLRRMTPENKVQIVQKLESSGRVCAMVGDGSNDAAAIRAATVGIGVLAQGSDPASVAADVVLVDSRIESLLPSILEGRQLWQRVQAAVSVLLGGNVGEVAFAIIGTAISGVSPLNTRQLLLVNMLTDALPAAGLAVSKPSDPLNVNARGRISGPCGVPSGFAGRRQRRRPRRRG